MSEYGSRIISANGGRQIDHKRLVPQLIGTVWCGNYAAYDYPAQNGWTYRVWAVPTATARPYVMFFSMPKTTHEVYYSGASCIYAPGAAVDPPTLYYFALDYADYGNERYGRRVWGPTGALLYDSGKTHLNIDQVFSGMSPNMGYNNHEASFVLNGWGSPKGWIPDNPALSVDIVQLVEDYGDRFTGRGKVEAKMFYRFTSDSQLQSIFSVYAHTLDETTLPPNNYSVIWRSPGLNNTAMVIDRWQHDV